MSETPSGGGRMTRGDLVFAAVCVLVTLVGGAIGVAGFSRAFPEASIDFKVTREQAVEAARAELKSRGFDVTGMKPLVLFDHDDEAKVYLERTLGLAKANPLFGKDVPVWRWTVRFVKPLQTLEYVVYVDPSGRPTAFRRILPEKEASPDAGEAGARALAEKALAETFGIPAGSARFVETTSDRRPARVDRTYTWESTTLRHGDGALRWTVEVQGDRVGRAKAFYKVPEKWIEEYGLLRSKNVAANSISTVGLLLTMLALLATFVARVRRGDVKWKWAVAFGLTGAVLQLLSSLNELPVTLFSYDTADAWGSVVAKAVLGGAGGAILLGAVLFLMVAGGEPLYREAYPGKPALGRIFSRRGVGSRPFFRGLLLGYALTGFFFAYQVIFYVLAEKAGAWAPADVPYSNLLGTSFPWLAVLLMGFMPATTEEFLSRMFSIPFFRRFLPVGLAVVVPAFLWGFAHAAYPNQPFWIRGVEVGVAGCLIGAVMLKADLFPLLVWHFTVDAVYTSLILVRSTNPYFVVSGALAAGVLLLPLLVALFLYFRRGGFVDSEELTNGAVGTAEPRAQEDEELTRRAGTARAPNPLSPKLLAGVAAVGAVALAAGLLLPRWKGKEKPYAVSRTEALAAAENFVKARGDDPARYRRAAFAETALPSLKGPNDTGAGLVPYGWSDDAERWILEKGGAGALERWSTKVLPGAVWQARFVKPGDRHGWWVVVDGRTAKVVGYSRMLPEEEKGASLDADAARAKADAALAAAGYDPATYAFTLVTSKAVDRKGRRDHRIVLESTKDGMALGEARLRASVSVAGDSVSDVAVGLKLPEDWLRARELSTPASYVAIGWKVLGIGTLVGLFLFELVRTARRGAIPWKRAALGALVPLAFLAASGAVSWPVFLKALPGIEMLTDETFAVMVGVAWSVQLVLLYGIGLLALGLILAVRPDALASLTSRAWDGRRSLLAAAASLLLLAGARALRGALATALPVLSGLGPDGAPASVDTLAPVLPPLFGAVQAALLWGTVAALGVLLLRDLLASVPARAVTAFVFVGVLVSGSAKTFGELFVPLAGSLLAVGALLAALWLLLGDDPPALVLAAFAATAGRTGLALVESGIPSWRLSGALLLALVAALAAWVGSRKLPPPAPTIPDSQLGVSPQS